MLKNKNKNTSKINLTAAAPLLKRAAVFLLVFIIYSSLIGPRIISGNIVNSDHFSFYGGLGKACLFGVIALIILLSRNKNIIKLNKWIVSDLIWLVLSVLSFLLAWLCVSRLLSGSHSLKIIIFAQVFILLSIILAALGVFGIENIRRLFAAYKKELAYSILLACGFYVILLVVYSLWSVLAAIVLHSVRWLLNKTGVRAIIIPPRSLLLNKFGINVAKYCSGIDSIALFSSLYILIGILDWGKFNHHKYLWIFPLALIVLFVFNILRVYLLVLGGYYINPRIAFSLFHTYAGMVFFIIYSAIFWGISYRWMLKKS